MSEDKPCILSNHCPYLTAVCKVSEPDEGCYVYRYFKKLIDKNSYDEGMEDAWETVKKLYLSEYGLVYRDLEKIFGDYNSETILTNNSAKEAKEKIDNYIKQRDEEFRVGDEVKHKLDGFKGVVVEVVNGNNNETFLRILFNGMYTGTYTNDKLIKTGRHFDEVETLLDKLKEE